MSFISHTKIVHIIKKRLETYKQGGKFMILNVKQPRSDRIYIIFPNIINLTHLAENLVNFKLQIRKFMEKYIQVHQTNALTIQNAFM